MRIENRSGRNVVKDFRTNTHTAR